MAQAIIGVIVGAVITARTSGARLPRAPAPKPQTPALVASLLGGLGFPAATERHRRFDGLDAPSERHSLTLAHASGLSLESDSTMACASVPE
jgi:hypothetical protein